MYNGLSGSECKAAAVHPSYVLKSTVRLLQEEKVAEVERELNEAQHRVEGAKGVYELIVRRMSEELARFQRERASELAAVLRAFALAQAQLAGDTAKVRAFLSVESSSKVRLVCAWHCAALLIRYMGKGRLQMRMSWGVRS